MKLSFEDLQRRKREREQQSQSGRVRADDARAQLRREWQAARGCPGEVEFGAYCEGTLGLVRRIKVARHVRRCPFCQEALTVVHTLGTDLQVIAEGEAPRRILKRTRKLGWAFAGVAAALVLASLWSIQDRVERTLVRFALQDVRELRVRSRGPRTTVVCDLRGIGRDGRPVQERGQFPVRPDGSVDLEMRSRPGAFGARLRILEGDIAGGRDYVGAALVDNASNEMLLGRNERGWGKGSAPKATYDSLMQLIAHPELAQELFELPSGKLELMLAELARKTPELRFKVPSVNLFDDVRVYSTEKVFLDQRFDREEHGFSLPDDLQVIWAGRLMQTMDLTSSLPGRSCLLTEAYPNWNGHAGIPLAPIDLPSGEVTYEISFYLTDPRKGVSFGLKLVKGVMAEDNAGMLEADEGQLKVDHAVLDPTDMQRAKVVAQVSADRWHRVRATVHLADHTMDLWLDGKQVGHRVQLLPSPGNPNFDFTHFSFGGVNFLNRQ